jgi:hypothetical protein
MTTAFRVSPSNSAVAVRGCFIAPRVRLVSAGPSGARTQEGRIVGTIWPTEDAVSRSVSAAARCARGAMKQPLSALDPSQRAPLASAGPSDARTQGGRQRAVFPAASDWGRSGPSSPRTQEAGFGGAKDKSEDAGMRSVPGVIQAGGGGEAALSSSAAGVDRGRSSAKCARRRQGCAGAREEGTQKRANTNRRAGK